MEMYLNGGLFRVFPDMDLVDITYMKILSVTFLRWGSRKEIFLVFVLTLNLLKSIFFSQREATAASVGCSEVGTGKFLYLTVYEVCSDPNASGEITSILLSLGRHVFQVIF